MRRLLVLVLGLAIVSCGRHKKDDNDDDDDGPAYVPVAPGVGDTGREAGGTSDGVPVAGKQPGTSTGSSPQPLPPQPGEPGQPGLPGPVGPIGGVVLFDVENQQIGVKLHDDAGSVAHVVLSDHRYAMIDRETGELVPLLDFTCLYEANDCTGACYVYDKRWLNLVLEDASGKTWVADRNAANQGAKLMQSYGTIGGQCVENAIGTTESYLAEPYTLPAGLTLPFAAPLYWDVSS